MSDFLYDITVDGNVTATSHITEGGTANQFTKGDGTLDPTTYLTSSDLISKQVVYSQSVATATSYPLKNTDLVELTAVSNSPYGYTYRVKLSVIGTGSDIGTSYLLIPNGSGAWEILAIGEQNQTSNTPNLVLDSGIPSITHHHAETYIIKVFLEEFYHNGVKPNQQFFGADGLISSIGDALYHRKFDGTTTQIVTNDSITPYLPLAGGTMTGNINMTANETTRLLIGTQSNSGDVHLGASGRANPTSGTQDYGFYLAHNAYRHTDDTWRHSRTTSIGATRFTGAGGGSSGPSGFRMDYSASSGSGAITWTNLMSVGITGNVGFGVETPTTLYSKILQVHATGVGAEIRLSDSTSGSGTSDGTLLMHYASDTYHWNRENGTFWLGNNNAARVSISSGLGDLEVLTGVTYPRYLGRKTHETGHLVGGYNNIGVNQAKSNPIYVIGSAYNPPEASVSGMYGIGYTRGTDASFIGTAMSGTPTGWGLYGASEGVARWFLDSDTGNIHTGLTATLYAYDAAIVNDITIATQGKIIMTAGTDTGLYGTYSPTEKSLVYSMGAAYKLGAANDGFGNVYGLVREYSTTLRATGHMYTFAANGIPTVSLGACVWTTGSLIMGHRSASFPDTTGYGQYWVNNVGTGQPYFTDDAGTDSKLLQTLDSFIFSPFNNQLFISLSGDGVAPLSVDLSPLANIVTVNSEPITIPNPTASDGNTIFYTPIAITITDVVSHITGTTNVVFNIQHASTRDGTGLDVFSSNITLTSTSGQTDNTGFNDATIPANSWVWLNIVSVSGSPTMFHATMIYTED